MVDVFDPLVLTMLVYFALTVAVAWWFGRGAGEGYVQFTLAGKDLSLSVYTLTYFATYVGGGNTMGIAQMAFMEGISAQWFAMVQGLAWMTITLIIGFIYSFDVVSMPELLGRAYDRYAKYFAAIFTTIGQIALTAGQTIGMASVIAVVTEIPLSIAFLASVAAFVGITLYGGMSSVAWTDAIHGVLIIVGMAVAIPIAVLNVGGVETVTANVPEGHMNWFGIGLVQIGSWYLMYIMVAGAQQQMLQRTWSAESRHVAIFGTFLAGLMVTGYGILTAAAGMIANAQGADINSSMAFAWTLTNTLPPELAGLLLAAAVASVMTGADSFLLAGATTFVNDLYAPLRGGRQAISNDHLLRVTRLTILAFGVGAALIALSGIEIVAINTLGMGLMSVLFAGVVTLFWHRTTRRSAFAGFVVGGITFVVWVFVLGEPEFFGEGTLEAAVPATAAAFVTIVVVSYLIDGERLDIAATRDQAAEDMATVRKHQPVDDD